MTAPVPAIGETATGTPTDPARPEVDNPRSPILSGFIGSLFLLIGSLGLYGLITFVVNRKGKEVAIRKVLGASVRQILVMFSREYVQLVAISFILAVPLAYYGVNSWLSNFKEHIPLSWWRFAIPGLVVLIVALIIVSSKSARTANANPVDKLKYE